MLQLSGEQMIYLNSLMSLALQAQARHAEFSFASQETLQGLLDDPDPASAPDPAELAFRIGVALGDIPAALEAGEVEPERLLRRLQLLEGEGGRGWSRLVRQTASVLGVSLSPILAGVET